MAIEITELAILFSLAAGIGIFAKLLKQPLTLAYIAAGLVIGLGHFMPLADNPIYSLFSDLGIMFLLFLIGLEINMASLRLIGWAALIIGLAQIVLTFAGGFIIAMLLGFSTVTAAYIAMAMTLSSTIVVVKLLSEKRDLQSLYGKITIGILLVQDLVAIGLLLFLASGQSGSEMDLNISIFGLLRGVILLGLMLWLGLTVMPKVFDKIARSTELVFITSLAWLFIVVAVVYRLGFSIEIGGFLAGLALANSAEHFQIGSRVKPLRDFFLLLFFITLGSQMVLSDFSGLTMPIIVLSLFVLIGNPLIILLIMGLMGYHRRTSFFTGLTMAQISEFSLVLAALGLKLGHLDNTAVTLITAVGLITIALSSYLIIYTEKFYRRLEQWLKLFEYKKPQLDKKNLLKSRPIVLIGAQRTGRNILSHLRKKDVLIIDFDPEVVKDLAAQGYVTVYGDIDDPDIDEIINLSRTRLIVSTSPDLENNLNLLQTLRAKAVSKKRTVFIVRGETLADAKELYRAGADYVLLPALSSGQYLGKILAEGYDYRRINKLRRRESSHWSAI